MGTWIERLRLHLTSDLRVELAKLREQIEAQRSARLDAATVQPLITAALAAEASRAPDELSAWLRPMVEDLVARRLRARANRRWRITAAVVVVGAGAAILWWWQGQQTAALAVLPGPAAAIAAPVVENGPAPVVLEQHDRGFGLGLAGRSDEEIALAVRDRLGRCHELAGAAVSFSVKEGWVWLEGEASRTGREAAARALVGLGDGVVVVNQIDEPAPARIDEAGVHQPGEAG